MLFNINKQKQIKTADKLLISAKPSFLHIPILSPNSYLQSSFSGKILSDSCIVPAKFSFVSSKTELSSEKEQSYLSSTSFLRFYKTLSTRKRKWDIINFKRIFGVKKLLSSFMHSPLKKSAKICFSSPAQITRLSIVQKQSLQNFSLDTQKSSPNLKKTYSLFFEIFRNSISLRPFLLRASKTTFRLAVSGLVHSVIVKKQRYIQKKRKNFISFRSIKFLKEKEKFNSFNRLKMKTFLTY